MINLKHKTHHLMLAISITLSLAACGKSGADAQKPMAMPAMPVSLIEMQTTSVPIQVEAIAQTEGAKEIEIRPRVGGIVIKKLFEEGARVKAGQAMFLIDPMPYRLKVSQARAQLAQQEARVRQAEREEKRLKKLLETKSISQRDYDNAVSDADIAKASAQEFEAMLHDAELNLSYAKVTAPESGIAGRFIFSEGALVTANSSLLTTIVQTSPIWVRFSLSDSELAQIGGMLNEGVAKKIALILPDGTEYPESGKLNFSASQIDPTFGTQQLRAVFKNADNKLYPGQFVRIQVTTGQRDGVYLVPQTAVLTGEQGKFVFVARKDKDGKMKAMPQPVEAGGWSGQNWVILGGLNKGDQVIVNNLIKLRPGAEVMPMPPMPPKGANPAQHQNSDANKKI